MNKFLKWLFVAFVTLILLPFTILFFIFRKAKGVPVAHPENLENLDEDAKEYVKSKGSTTDIGTRYKYLRITDKLTPVRPSVHVGLVEDKKINGPKGTQLPIRIYTPIADGPYKVMLYFHDGGFINGSIQTTDALARDIVEETGFKVITVDYRLAPDSPFPAAIEDAYTALEWAYSHPASLGYDGTGFIVAGEGAGANLAAVISIMARDKKSPATISEQLLFSPITDIFSRDASVLYPSFDTFDEGFVLTKDGLDKMFSLYIADNYNLKYNPLVAPIRTKDLSNLPPALIISAQFDPLRDQSRKYAEALKKADVTVDYHEIERVTHGYMEHLPRAASHVLQLVNKFVK
ncbi:putative esterase/lipase [Brochothrix thermosphacta]|uniref:alpha/beta hydrolase n=1 Tax=Brochothrix thermosphacta TaxID=2756 RepID=UPI00083F91E7|nr:alpha/beta hydrolase [Brochothrix thermosphacta]ODJ67512.1 lipase [Brochothrix thermosphacta]SPN71102.1 putative esterase/lipase [Brochothrix thermosphacta]